MGPFGPSVLHFMRQMLKQFRHLLTAYDCLAGTKVNNAKWPMTHKHRLIRGSLLDLNQ
jgi:hypothetical protein